MVGMIHRKLERKRKVESRKVGGCEWLIAVEVEDFREERKNEN